MSDLYLILRTRLEEVADWVQLGPEVMREARTRRGLSYESAARLAHISSKTYERREKAGRWPSHDVAQLAEILDLDIDQPARTQVTLDREAPAVELLQRQLEADADRLRVLEATVEREGQAMTRALRALAKEVRALAPQREQPNRPATKRVAS
jgi:predicted transcriptional regulator